MKKGEKNMAQVQLVEVSVFSSDFSQYDKYNVTNEKSSQPQFGIKM